MIMKRLALILLALIPAMAFAQKADELAYTDARELMLLNKGFDNTELYYSRLPQDMKSVTRDAVWELGLNSAGLAVRFCTDSKTLGVKWTPLFNGGMSHMAATGVKGIDFYYLNEKGEWSFFCTAKPNGKESKAVVIRNMDGKMREYLAYLPLYDGVERVAIGVDSDATIGKPRNNVLIKGASKPIVFYGTSITQGGCASRPGMLFTSIISRRLNKEVVNLGFSGNARMDKSMADIVARVDADTYVIDCLPNCTSKILQDSAYVFLTKLATARPDSKIYMVESYVYGYESLDLKTKEDQVKENATWNEIYKRLRKEGYRNFRYVERRKVTEKDTEGTVDGTHRTDLGFQRMADLYLKFLK